jgi:hypothetical protein
MAFTSLWQMALLAHDVSVEVISILEWLRTSAAEKRIFDRVEQLLVLFEENPKAQYHKS